MYSIFIRPAAGRQRHEGKQQQADKCMLSCRHTMQADTCVSTAAAHLSACRRCSTASWLAGRRAAAKLTSIVADGAGNGSEGTCIGFYG